MKKSILLAAVAAVSLGLATQSQAQITVSVYPSLAPNAFGSPSFNTYVTNALAGVQNGGTTTGAAGPGQYSSLPSGSHIDYRDAIVTGFPSWMGVADPTDPTYAGEYGNRTTFGLDIKGNGQKISINDLSFNAVSSDPDDVLGFGYAGGYTYGAHYIGIIYGSPNTILNDPSEDGTPVDEIVGVGSGNSMPVYTAAEYAGDPVDDGPDPDPGATDQQRIDDAYSDYGLPNNFNFTGTYTIDGVSGSASVNFVPEPASLSALALGGCALLRRRKTKLK